MSTLNPKPRDLNKVVLVVNGDECRLRRDDEATESGKEMEHTKFIVARSTLECAAARADCHGAR